jgi:DNA polymerase III epsilon subunit-like protein
MNGQLLPIVLDIETSGLDLLDSGIWQIGAIDLNTMDKFFEEARIDDEDKIQEKALNLINKTEKELRNKENQSQKELLKKFTKWVDKRKMKNFICQNPQFDISFLKIKIKKYGIDFQFHHRAFDTHSIAQTKFNDLNNNLLINENYSGMGLTNILNFCGIKDDRQMHNAFEDSKLTAECFNRLMFGKTLFPEFNEFEIPEGLKK